MSLYPDRKEFEQPVWSELTAATYQATADNQLVQAALTDQFIKGCLLKAGISNAGTVWIGGSGTTSSDGFPLKAGETLSLTINNLSILYILFAKNNDTIVVLTGK
jgi:hypothetical protein